MKNFVATAAICSLLFSCSNSNSASDDVGQLDSLSLHKADSLKQYTLLQDSIKESEIIKKSKVSYEKLTELRSRYIGLLYEYPKSTDFIANNGYPETLDGTDNSTWVVYFPKGDITVVMNKQTNLFTNICFGKNESLKTDVSNNLSKFIGKRMSYDSYTKNISSIKYGAPERLGSQNCINKKCVEYYPNGQFTTVAFYEFPDDGDYVTLLRIAPFKDKYLGSF